MSTATLAPQRIRCGNPGCWSPDRTHATAEQVRDCYAVTRQQEEQAEFDAAAERANERALEDRGYWESQAQDDYERRNGVIDFIDAWCMESPETCPRHDH